MAELKVKIDKLSGPETWNKWKWELKMTFNEIYRPELKSDSSEIEKQRYAEWCRENAKAASLIASALTPHVANYVLTYTNAKDIWDKLVSVYEQSSVQRLSLLSQNSLT